MVTGLSGDFKFQISNSKKSGYADAGWDKVVNGGKGW
jgi:hypothetical protein